MSSPSRLVAKLAVAALSAIVGLVVVFCIGEVVVRRHEARRSTVPGSMPLMYYPVNRLGYALVRNADNFGWVHVDSGGFRGPDLPVDKTPGVVRIAVMGGSTTFDIGVKGDANTWPARLQYWLERQAPGRKFEVINAGVPGYHVFEDFERLNDDVATYKPDVIIEYQGHNDLFQTFRDAVQPPDATNTPGESEPRTPWGYWLERHSLLYAKLDARFAVLRFKHLGNTLAKGKLATDTAAVTRAELDELGGFERELTAFVVMAQMMGTRVVLPLVVHASAPNAVTENDPDIRTAWQQGVPFVPVERTLAGYRLVNDAIGRVADRTHATLIRTTEFGIQGKQYYAEGDPVHFNNAGADLMARRVAERLLASGVLDSIPSPTSGGSVVQSGAPSR